MGCQRQKYGILKMDSADRYWSSYLETIITRFELKKPFIHSSFFIIVIPHVDYRILVLVETICSTVFFFKKKSTSDRKLTWSVFIKLWRKFQIGIVHLLTPYSLSWIKYHHLVSKNFFTPLLSNILWGARKCVYDWTTDGDETYHLWGQSSSVFPRKNIIAYENLDRAVLPTTITTF